MTVTGGYGSKWFPCCDLVALHPQRRFVESSTRGPRSFSQLASASRVVSVISNGTGEAVFCWITVARARDRVTPAFIRCAMERSTPSGWRPGAVRRRHLAGWRLHGHRHRRGRAQQHLDRRPQDPGGAQTARAAGVERRGAVEALHPRLAPSAAALTGSAPPGAPVIDDIASGREEAPIQLATASLDPVTLPRSSVVTYCSFDGALVSAILTLPFNLKRNGSNPAGVMPHGGPTSQATDYFNKTATALASRGHLMIQPIPAGRWASATPSRLPTSGARRGAT